VLHEYECVGDFAPYATPGALEAVPEAPMASMELVVDASTPPPTSENQEAPLPQPTEAVETAVAIAATSAAKVVVGEAGSSPSLPTAAEADEVRVPDEPAAVIQEQVAPEGTTRAASPEIQETEETRVAALTGVASGEVQSLELACTSWAATSGSGDDIEDGEEATACNTLERGLNWVHRAFDELILPATSVSFLV
jgi:hypothetical protein